MPRLQAVSKGEKHKNGRARYPGYFLWYVGYLEGKVASGYIPSTATHANPGEKIK
jgi:hypothetical protein